MTITTFLDCTRHMPAEHSSSEAVQHVCIRRCIGDDVVSADTAVAWCNDACVGRLTTLCRLWQHTWLVINDADIGRNDKSNAYATGCERDKNGQSIKCCPRERCRWTVHMHARHRLNVLLAVRRGRCPWTVEMNVLPSATVPMPDSCLLRLLSYRNTRPATPQRALLHRDPHRLLNTKQQLSIVRTRGSAITDKPAILCIKANVLQTKMDAWCDKLAVAK